jgi:hypothetical protein
MQRHKQMSHWFQRGSSQAMHDTSYQSNSSHRPGFFNETLNSQYRASEAMRDTSYQSNSSHRPGFFNETLNSQFRSQDLRPDEFWMVLVLNKLNDISSSLWAIESILNQRSLGTRF